MPLTVWNPGPFGSIEPSAFQMSEPGWRYIELGSKLEPRCSALPGVRQRVVAKTELQAEARRHVPVIHRIDRWRLVDVVADRQLPGTASSCWPGPATCP